MAVVLLLVALVARLAFIVATPAYLPRHDDGDYDRLARGIAAAGVYPDGRYPDGHPRPTAYRPPGYPYALGGVYAIFGRGEGRIAAARVIQAVIGTTLVALVGLVGGWALGPPVGLVAMALSAVYPAWIAMSSVLFSEPLFVALELGALAAVLAHRRRADGLRWALVAGVLLGLATLTRTNGPLLAVGLIVGLWDRRPRRSWQALAAPAVCLLAALLTVAPWTIRNALVLHALVPVSTQDGGTAIGTYNSTSLRSREYPAGWLVLSAIPSQRDVFERQRTMSEPEVNRVLRERVRAFLGEHPLYPVRVAFWNSARLFDLAGHQRTRLTGATMGLSAGAADAGARGLHLVGALALLGALTAGARRAPRFLWLTALVLWLGTVFVVSETPRFRAPLDPFVLLLAALALTSAMCHVVHRRARRHNCDG